MVCHLLACRAKNIRNVAVVNEDADQRTLLRKYERELRKLRSELTRRNQELVDKRALLELQEAQRRAEADKLAALTALENASAEFMREKEEKKALEAKIAAMQSQLLIGGSKPEDIPAFRTLLAKVCCGLLCDCLASRHSQDHPAAHGRPATHRMPPC
jgi:hypothetical protein